MPLDGICAVGFQRAADMIVEAARSDDRNPDDLFYPVAYLYRHHLELMLKALVGLGVEQGGLEGCDDMLTGHNLHKLWHKAKQLIRQAWADSPENDLKATEQMILEFHALDETGQAFRYERDKQGRQHLQNAPDRVDLDNLKARTDGVSQFLGAAYGGIDI